MDYFNEGFVTIDAANSVRQASWHRKETPVFRQLTLPADRAEAYRLAGHDFTVTEVPNGNIGRVVDPSTYQGDIARVSGEWRSLDVRQEKKGLYVVQMRDGEPGPLHGNFIEVVNGSLAHIPNGIGWDLLEALLGEGCLLDTGFVLLDGAQCVITAYLPKPVVIDGDDSRTFPFVSCSWGHNGSLALTARSTAVREVCWNTVNMSEALASKAGTQYTFKHTAGWREKVKDAQKVISGLTSTFEQYVEIANELAAIEVTPQQRDLFVSTIIGDAVWNKDDELSYRSIDPTTSPRVKKNLEDSRTKVLRLFVGDTIPEAHALTGYGLFQAGTEYFDHLRSYQSQDSYVRRQLLSYNAEKADLQKVIRRVAQTAA